MPPRPSTKNEKNLTAFLNALGLSPDENKIYQTLTTYGPLTILELSRKSGIPRTRVYRTLADMRSSKLVDEIIDEHRTLAQAVEPDHLDAILRTKQSEVDNLTRLFPQVQNYLTQQINRRQSNTQVKFYKGITGIQQMAANVLNATTEIVGYTQTDFAPIVGRKFANWFYKEFQANNLHMRDIYSDRYLKSIGGANNTINQSNTNYANHFNSRYLPSKTLDVIHALDIYNHVVAFYDWQGSETDIFGVEIYNPKVAQMQRQLFEVLWPLAIPNPTS